MYVHSKKQNKENKKISYVSGTQCDLPLVQVGGRRQR